MISFTPKELTVAKMHHYLLGSIGPRPIAFASTIDENGQANLAPFSFFNVFSANGVKLTGIDDFSITDWQKL